MKTSTDYITKAQVVARGWTESMVKKFLGEPDATKTNPMYKCAAPMKLYDVKRVERIERSKSFREYMEAAAARKASARKAVTTKLEKALNYAKSVEIEIPAMDYTEVVKRACRAYNDWRQYDRNGFLDIDFIPADPRHSDADFLRRITTNYLRHECSSYDEHLCELFGKTGVNEAHDILQRRINDEIKRTYPQLNPRLRRYVLMTEVWPYISEQELWFANDKEAVAYAVNYNDGGLKTMYNDKNEKIYDE